MESHPRRSRVIAIVLLLAALGASIPTWPALWGWVSLRTVEETYEDGAACFTYRVKAWGDAEGKRHGRFRAWHRDGTLSFRGRFDEEELAELDAWDESGVPLEPLAASTRFRLFDSDAHFVFQDAKLSETLDMLAQVSGLRWVYTGGKQAKHRKVSISGNGPFLGVLRQLEESGFATSLHDDGSIIVTGPADPPRQKVAEVTEATPSERDEASIARQKAEPEESSESKPVDPEQELATDSASSEPTTTPAVDSTAKVRPPTIPKRWTSDPTWIRSVEAARKAEADGIANSSRPREAPFVRFEETPQSVRTSLWSANDFLLRTSDSDWQKIAIYNVRYRYKALRIPPELMPLAERAALAWLRRSEIEEDLTWRVIDRGRVSTFPTHEAAKAHFSRHMDKNRGGNDGGPIVKETPRGFVPILPEVVQGMEEYRIIDAEYKQLRDLLMEHLRWNREPGPWSIGGIMKGYERATPETHARAWRTKGPETKVTNPTSGMKSSSLDASPFSIPARWKSDPVWIRGVERARIAEAAGIPNYNRKREEPFVRLEELPPAIQTKLRATWSPDVFLLRTADAQWQSVAIFKLTHRDKLTRRRKIVAIPPDIMPLAERTALAWLRRSELKDELIWRIIDEGDVRYFRTNREATRHLNRHMVKPDDPNPGWHIRETPRGFVPILASTVKAFPEYKAIAREYDQLMNMLLHALNPGPERGGWSIGGSQAAIEPSTPETHPRAWK